MMYTVVNGSHKGFRMIRGFAPASFTKNGMNGNPWDLLIKNCDFP